MKNAIDELKTSSVLTKEEIERIKLYVEKKYPYNSVKENASVLSSTIYDIIDTNLEGLDLEDKKNIKKNIIKNSILKDKKNILKWDVFNELTTELGKKPHHNACIVKWLNNNQSTTISEDTFEKYIIAKGYLTNDETAASLDIELQLSPNMVKNIEVHYKLVKHEWVTRTKSKYKSILITYKNEVSAKLIRVFDKTSYYLEYFSNATSKRKITFSILALMILSLYSLNYAGINIAILNVEFKNKNIADKKHMPTVDVSEVYVMDAMSYHPHLPDYFNYKDIDKGKLLSFLNTRNSILAQEPYFSAIIRSSKEFNLNPYLLFAITGQEQSFVPRNHKDAQKIANNPFNVFHSWQEYNTDIYDSSRIAARTVINLAKDKPADVDIFEWINNKYAGDKNWGNGVKSIFEKLGQ